MGRCESCDVVLLLYHVRVVRLIVIRARDKVYRVRFRVVRLSVQKSVAIDTQFRFASPNGTVVESLIPVFSFFLVCFGCIGEVEIERSRDRDTLRGVSSTGLRRCERTRGF